MTIETIKWKYVTNCPVCGSSESQISVQTIPINILKCQHCLVQFSQSVQSDVDIQRYYQEDFSSERHRFGQMMNASINYHLIESARLLTETTKILDVGCGYGYLLEMIRLNSSRIAELSGIEISRVERNHSLNLGSGRFQVYEELKNVPDDKFDLVVCNEVIEHIAQPLPFLNEIYKKLKKNGKLFLLTDNFDSKIVAGMGASFPKWIPHSHVVHFGPNSLEHIFSLSNFDLHSQFMFFTPFEVRCQWIIFKLKKILGVPKSIDFNEYKQDEFDRTFRLYILRKFLNLIMVKFFPKPRDGTLVYCVAEK